MIIKTIQLYRNAYTGLTKRMCLLSVVMLINRMGTMVLPFMTLYCNKLGFTSVQGGLAVALYGVGSIFGAFIGGKLSDKIGFYYVQFSSLFFGGLMFMILGQIHTFNNICIIIFITSLINEAFRPANSSAIAYYSTPKNRTQSYSLNRLAINLGWGIGSAVAGILASISYQLLFWVDGVTNITAAILLLIILPKVTISNQLKNIVQKTNNSISPYKDKIFIYFIGLIIMYAFCFYQLFTTVPLYFKEGFKLNEFWIGVIMSVNGILIALFEMVIVFKLEGKFLYLKLIKYSCIILAVSFFILNLPIINKFLIASLSIFIVTIAEIVGMPFMNSFYISRTTASNRGSYAALYTMAWSIAQVIGSLCGTQIAHTIGFNNLWWIIGAICIFTAIGFNFLKLLNLKLQ